MYRIKRSYSKNKVRDEESYRMVIGKKAESLVKGMMEELGFIVIPFGYEHTLPQFAKKDNLLKGQAGQLIRSIPDFLIVDRHSNRAYLIEVKYSKHNELEEYRVSDFPETHIVLVSPEGLLSADREYMLKHPYNKNCFMYLTDIGPFKNKNKDIILKYVRKARFLLD